MKDLTLREMCTAFGISRRAVQGYSDDLVISIAGKNYSAKLLQYGFPQ